MATTEKWLLGSATTLLSTGLNSLADLAVALSSAFDNTQGQSGDGYTLCELQLDVTFASAPTANTAVVVWFLRCLDGTNYETYTATGTSTPPKARLPNVTFPLEAVTTQQIITRMVLLPNGLMKALLKNDGTGRAFPASGSTLKIRPVTRQGV